MISAGADPKLIQTQLGHASITITYDELCCDECPADVNGDTVVDVLDLLAVISAWGPC